MQRKKYAFAAAAEEEEEEEFTPSSPVRNEQKYDDDTFVNQFFTKKRPEIQIQQKPRSFSTNQRTNPLTTKPSSGFSQPNRKFRLKPDLTSDEEEDDNDEDGNLYNVSNLRSTSSAISSKDKIRKRQREASKQAELLALQREEDQKQRILDKQRERKLREEEKRKEKFWIGEVLQGAKRSMDDRGGPLGSKVVLRRDTVKESALPYEHGKGVYHAAYIDQRGVNSGRFFLDPQGVKRTETNSLQTILYLMVERTGAEGLTVRVGSKFYEVFDGDCVIVPTGAVYSVINPSKTSNASFTYLLIDVVSEEQTVAASVVQENDEQVLQFDYRSGQATAAVE